MKLSESRECILLVFTLLKCDELLLFFVEYDDKLNIFGFGTIRQNQTFEDVTLGYIFNEYFSLFFCHFMDKMINCNMWRGVPGRLCLILSSPQSKVTSSNDWICLTVQNQMMFSSSCLTNKVINFFIFP